MKLNFKARLARLRGKSTVRVQPRFRVPTFAAFEQVCLMCGLDPDSVREGKADLSTARLQDVLRDGSHLLDLVLENAADFDLSLFERPAAETFAGVVTAHFFIHALSTFELQAQELATLLCSPARTAFPTFARSGSH